jgi:hypothetical protein
MRHNVAGLPSGGGVPFDLPEWFEYIALGLPVLWLVGFITCVTILHWRAICNFLFGWAIRPSVAKANNRLVALAIYAYMNDHTLTEHYYAAKRKAWARCKWWNIDK